MINTINFDLDECLIHSMWPSEDCDQEHFVLNFGDGEKYNVVVRPQALGVIEHARSLVGAENVYILTSAISTYANKINELAGFGFLPSQIKAREDHCFPIKIAYGNQWPTHERYSKENVLIDNLPWSQNPVKMAYLGIKSDRYLKVRDYYGVNFPADTFLKNVCDFLDEKHKEIIC